MKDLNEIRKKKIVLKQEFLIESEYELESVTKLYLKQSRKILNELDPNQKKAYKEWKKQIID